MMKLFIPMALGVVIIFVLNQCNSKTGYNSKKMEAETYKEYLQKGDEISSLAQSVLLANVGKAIKQGGTEYAVEFCNLQASSIIDSLNTTNNAQISRVSIKNRNLENSLKNDLEKQLWEIFSQQIELGLVKDTVVVKDDKLIYYKPIKTAMPACMKCHGDPNSDIDPRTYARLQKLYPDDLATGYQLNDFRGLWKIEFSE